VSSPEVVECSASDFMATYAGHTGPRTIKQLERGLGKVLLIYEAYQFVKNLYGKEAVNEMVDAMTKAKFAGKLIIILAGYDRQMNELLQMNPGLNSRFPDEFTFPPMGVEDCLNHLVAKLQEENIAMPAIHDPVTYKQILDMTTELSGFEFWGNARDIQTLAKTMIRAVYQNNQDKVDQLEITPSLALQCVQNMLSDYRRIDLQSSAPPTESGWAPITQQPQLTEVRTISTPEVLSLERADAIAIPTAPRNTAEVHCDPEVTDETWAQLQKDKLARERELDRLDREILGKERDVDWAEEVEKKAVEAATIIQEQIQTTKEGAVQYLVKKSKLKRDKEIARHEAAIDGQILLKRLEDERKFEEYEEARERETARLDEEAVRRALRRPQEHCEEEAQKMTRIGKERRLDSEAKEAKQRESEAKAETRELRRERDRLKYAELKRKEKEELVQKRLRETGVCPMGYQWIPQQSGYRCAGGSHWVPASNLPQSWVPLCCRTFIFLVFNIYRNYDG
jgi:hypothetical protein